MVKKSKSPSLPGATQSKSSSSRRKKGSGADPEVLPAEVSRRTQQKQTLQGSKAHLSLDSDDSSSDDADSDAEIESDLDEAYPVDSDDLKASGLPVALADVEPDLPAVSPHDPLKRYLEEVRHFPLLTSEEEYNLVVKLREQGDLQAAKMLVSANLRLVVKIAFEYRTLYSNVLDLVQEGNIGLMKAVSKFDPTKGARLGYYASWWIRSYILKYLLDNFRLVKVGTTQAQKKLFYHLMREKEKLEAQGLLAGPKLLAEKLNVKEKEVIEMEQRLSGRGAEMSLDTPIDTHDGSSASHMDFLADPHETADKTLEREQILKILRDQLPKFQKLLNEKELRILNDRLLAEEPKTLQEVADLYGLTRERTRQIESKVIEKLRELLKESL